MSRIASSKMFKATFFSLNLISALSFAQSTVTLEHAINLAQANDPWLHGSQLKQSAMVDKAIAAGTLSDPKLSLTMANLPTDTWDLDQEGMTQFKMGVSQTFARGEVLKLRTSQMLIGSTKFPLLRANRKAKVKAIVSQLWLDVFLAQKTIALISRDKALFEQMVDIAKASYSSTVGKTRQQDVIRSQLELTQLDDRLTVQRQNLETALAQLNEWLHVVEKNESGYGINFDVQPAAFLVSEQLPKISTDNMNAFGSGRFSRKKMAEILYKHPAVLAIDVEQSVANKSVALAKEQYKPEWGINASYAHRDNAPSGDERADFFSIGVSIDVPLFTSNRQDKAVSASVSESEAIKTEKLLLIKSMLADIEKNVRQLKRLSERQLLYKKHLLKQTHDQAEASLTAYTNDDGDFAEVVRARITELNTKISALAIDVNALKTLVRINYFFTRAERQHVSSVGER